MGSSASDGTAAQHAPAAANAAPWHAFAAAEPGFAERVRAGFGAAKHHVLATLRRDGSPRVSGTETDFHRDQLLLGSMPDAHKALDLRRDPRMALHANPGDGSMQPGDVKVSGFAVEVTDRGEALAMVREGTDPAGFHLFQVLVTDAVITSVENDRLVIRHWRPGRGVAEVSR